MDFLFFHIWWSQKKLWESGKQDNLLLKPSAGTSEHLGFFIPTLLTARVHLGLEKSLWVPRESISFLAAFPYSSSLGLTMDKQSFHGEDIRLQGKVVWQELMPPHWYLSPARCHIRGIHLVGPGEMQTIPWQDSHQPAVMEGLMKQGWTILPLNPTYAPFLAHPQGCE
jgi:hypothetical protein